MGEHRDINGRFLKGHPDFVTKKAREKSRSKISRANRKFYYTKDELIEKYINQKMSTYEIAEQIGFSDVSVDRWLKKYNILIRSNSESHLGQEAWNKGDGRGVYPVEWNEKLKKRIRAKDHYKCAVCGVEYYNLMYYRQEKIPALHVHHIDYDKNNLDDDNLISLCVACHSKTAINKEYWQKILKKKIRERNNRPVF
ncbi:unnamed protein product, partial [marine sediment metagenome]